MSKLAVIDKKNAMDCVSHRSRVEMLVPRTVPAILRRRRRAPVQLKRISLLDDARSQRQSLDVASVFIEAAKSLEALEKRQQASSQNPDSSMSSISSSKSTCATHYLQRSAAELVPVLQDANQTLRHAQRRHDEILAQQDSAHTPLHIGIQGQCPQTPEQERAEAARRQAALKESRDVSESLVQLVAGTAQVLSHLTKHSAAS